MQTKTVYVAVDGRNFDNMMAAKDYEERLFETWLKEEGAKFREFVRTGSDDHEIARAVFKEYFVWSKTNTTAPR